MTGAALCVGEVMALAAVEVLGCVGVVVEGKGGTGAYALGMEEGDSGLRGGRLEVESAVCVDGGGCFSVII